MPEMNTQGFVMTMIQINSDKLNFKQCKELALLSISTRKGTPMESEKGVDEIAQSIENLSKNDAFQILTASDQNGKLCGWIYYYVAFPLMTFISGFYPVVAKTPYSEEIALELIEASKRNILKYGRSRLEIELVFPTEDHRAHSSQLVEWYRKCGFQFAAEEIHMKSDLSQIELPQLNVPKGYVLKKFSEVSYERLEDSGFRTLKNSMEGLFLSMSHSEQKVTLEYFFSKSKPHIEDSSLILEKDDEIIGFAITRVGDDGNPDIGPVGLVPEARGKGLGSYLIARVLQSLKDSGSTCAFLDTTITNQPAQKLYRKYGFEDEYFKQFYYWSPKEVI
ncbi:MAG: GNAT family N-acetyltransferase [Candidatus Thorarchaeota archaeon]